MHFHGATSELRHVGNTKPAPLVHFHDATSSLKHMVKIKPMPTSQYVVHFHGPRSAMPTTYSDYVATDSKVVGTDDNLSRDMLPKLQKGP